jgi:subtilase family serine protease
MRHRALLAVTAATLAGLTSMVSTTTAGAAPSQTGQLHSARVCSAPGAGDAACMSVVRTDATGKPLATATPSGLGPASIQSAYKLAGLTSGGRTVAIVDAYNDPTAEADLATYRAQFGLPACTTANGCFRKMDQRGGTAYPRTNGGWAQEISLDLDMVSATCPDCHILLVEADSNSFANLGAAVNAAATISGVAAISNSYGGGDAADTTYGTYYNHPGIAVTASTGDSGYVGGSYPASSSYVTAVGGTSLKTAANTRGWTETVWSGAGSGCLQHRLRQASHG